jgi:hypothetical protein
MQNNFILNISVEDPEFGNKLKKVKTSIHRAKATDRPIKYDRAPAPVENQGSLGSCVGFAMKSSITGHHKENLSALYIYRQAQFHDSKRGENYSGTTLSGACRSLMEKGVCGEALYPYRTDVNAPLPSLEANGDASRRKASDYFTMWWNEITPIQDLLLSGFNPAIAIYIHDEFYNIAPDGYLVREDNYLKSSKRGGHAMCLRGWEHRDGELYWKLHNSWGSSWGDHGCVYLSHSLLSKIGKGLYVSVYDDSAIQYKKMTWFDRLVFNIKLSFKHLIRKIF